MVDSDLARLSARLDLIESRLGALYAQVAEQNLRVLFLLSRISFKATSGTVITAHDRYLTERDTFLVEVTDGDTSPDAAADPASGDTPPARAADDSDSTADARPGPRRVGA